MRRATKTAVAATTILISDAPGKGWQVSLIPADQTNVQNLSFARRDCARAFAQGMSTAVATWRVTDQSTSRSPEDERAKADALMQFDLFIANSRDP